MSLQEIPLPAYRHLEGHEECMNSLLLTDKEDPLASGGMQGHLCFKMDTYHMASRIQWSPALVYEEPIAADCPSI